MGLQTTAIHAGESKEGGAIATPIHRSSTYELGEPETFDDIRYIRLNNTPSQRAVEEKLGAIEGGSALVLPSGTAAIWVAFATYIRPGSVVLAPKRVYGGTRKILDDMQARHQFEVRYVDLADPTSWDATNASAFYCESLSNPWLEVGALDKLVEFSKAHGLVSIVDNTLLTPVHFRPLAFGFDVVLHSASKHLNGHSDLVAGVLGATATKIREARILANRYGVCPDPQMCFLLARGIKTLPLRVRAQTESARALAKLLSEHPRVESVSHPEFGAPTTRARTADFFDGPGTMVTFAPKGEGSAKRVIAALKLPVEAPSLGGLESLVTRPITTSHAGIPAALREEMGVREEWIRVSVGVEDCEDILTDFAQALEHA